MEIVEVVKLKDRERAFYKNNIENKSYVPKCFNKTTLIEFNLSNKEMILIKDNKIIFIAKSDLIEDRIKDDNSKICLNRWGTKAAIF